MKDLTFNLKKMIQERGRGHPSWNDVPDHLKRYIIGFNPSLRELHADKFGDSLSQIRAIRRDRQCTLCVRKSIFSSPMSRNLSRRPSTRMYIVLTGPTSSGVRIRCMCKEHLVSGEGELLVAIPRDSEYPSYKFLAFVRSVFEDISSIIVYLGADEDDLAMIDAVRGGNMFATRESPRPRWKRVAL